jgi:hypothetical protein
MKITITYPTTQQCGPEQWESYTKVIHLSPDMTLQAVLEKVTGDWKLKPETLDVEIHFDMTEDESKPKTTTQHRSHRQHSREPRTTGGEMKALNEIIYAILTVFHWGISNPPASLVRGPKG